jgi:hypothetical protein
MACYSSQCLISYFTLAFCCRQACAFVQVQSPLSFLSCCAVLVFVYGRVPLCSHQTFSSLFLTSMQAMKANNVKDGKKLIRVYNHKLDPTHLNPVATMALPHWYPTGKWQ